MPKKPDNNIRPTALTLRPGDFRLAGRTRGHFEAHQQTSQGAGGFAGPKLGGAAQSPNGPF